MDQKLDIDLCRKYPHVFADRHASMRTTAMCWGFEVGNGWYGLLDKAAAALELLIIDYIRDNAKEANLFPWFLCDSWYGIRWSFRHPLLVARALWIWLAVRLGWRTPNPWWPRASQVKEKYGTLRFYLTDGTDEMYEIVDAAEKRSHTTCETCGRKGKVRGRGWYDTRCLPCWKKEQRA